MFFKWTEYWEVFQNLGYRQFNCDEHGFRISVTQMERI